MARFRQVNKSKCRCISLRRASAAVTEYYDIALRESGLSVNQYSILVNLSRMGEACTSELAEKVNLDRSTLVRNLKPIMARGLIDDLAKAGARSRRLCVSARGREVLERTLPAWERAQEGIGRYLGQADAEKLMELLHRLQELPDFERR